MTYDIYDRTEVKAEVAKRLRRAREIASTTNPSFVKINDFASFIKGIEVPTYYHYETARKLAPIFVIKQVAELTGEDPAYLYCLSDTSALVSATKIDKEEILFQEERTNSIPLISISKTLLDSKNVEISNVEFLTINEDIYPVDTSIKTVNKPGFYAVKHHDNLIIINLTTRIDDKIVDDNGIVFEPSETLIIEGKVIFRCLF
ncbi:hypothetical protein JK628_02885 [Shewanella sp. KX20019]|uniref:hypothetical protein n=1 Tax=Shewanella sp. KX20019 TaxID=2803864 RepID=UPI001926D52B|nr:hypothetical protein [Shewanella sp. KX20019]QQX80835.1 hypothetical protein JK628_02885 [Shewanella sp. KX20019]